MKSIAIITARGGSKRIPRKNIKSFCGKPIIAYSIEAALQSKVFDDVIVSTDDDEIKVIAEKYGASVPFLRSKKNSDDFSTTADVLKEVIKQLKEDNKEYDFLACIYPTAPFITAGKIREAFDLFFENKADTLMTVVPYSYPPQRGFFINENHLQIIDETAKNKRSQDLDVMYHDAGQLYLTRVNTFIKANSLMSGKMIPFVVSELEVQDIDTNTDWELAELKYKRLYEVK